MSAQSFKNVILQRLKPAVIDRLDLRRVELPVNREIEFPGNGIAHLFFIEEGIASMTVTFEDGFEVEVALAGPEAILGSGPGTQPHVVRCRVCAVHRNRGCSVDQRDCPRGH